MFYDERIEGIKAETAKKSILISVLIALVMAVVRSINIIINSRGAKYLWLVVTEYTVVLVGGLCLAVGFIIKKTSGDERSIFTQARFYNKAYPVLIMMVLFLYSVMLPISNIGIMLKIMNKEHFIDLGFSAVIELLIFVVGLYTVHSFKKNDVYFNYSLMEDEHYYRGVLKNTAKLAVVLLSMLALSIAVSVAVVIYKKPDGIFEYFLSIFLEYVFLFIKISGVYFIYSVMEKVSYDREGLISKASTVSLFITVLLQAIWTLFAVTVKVLDMNDTDGLGLLYSVDSLDIYIVFALMIFLTYFKYEYDAGEGQGILNISYCMILLSQVAEYIFSYIYTAVNNIFIFDIIENGNHSLNETLSLVKIYADDAFGILAAAGIALLIVALMRKGDLHRGNIVFLILLVAFGAVEIFIRDQAEFLTTELYQAVYDTAVLVYIAVVTVSISKKRE